MGNYIPIDTWNKCKRCTLFHRKNYLERHSLVKWTLSRFRISRTCNHLPCSPTQNQTEIEVFEALHVIHYPIELFDTFRSFLVRRHTCNGGTLFRSCWGGIAPNVAAPRIELESGV